MGPTPWPLSGKYSRIRDAKVSAKLTRTPKAVADWPAIAFSEELLAAYPEAKVILPGRDVDSWHSSVLKTVYWRASDVELRVASYLDPAAGMYRPMLKKFFKTFFEDDFPNRGKEIFHEHYKNIRSLVPQEKLLEYNVKQGWDPLCKFLGEPVPFDPFPHVNDAKSFVARCRSRNRKQIAGGIFRILIAAYLLIWGWSAMRHFDHRIFFE